MTENTKSTPGASKKQAGSAKPVAVPAPAAIGAKAPEAKPAPIAAKAAPVAVKPTPTPPPAAVPKAPQVEAKPAAAPVHPIPPAAPAKVAPVAVKPASPAPNIKSAPTAQAPAPKPAEAAATTQDVPTVPAPTAAPVATGAKKAELFAIAAITEGSKTMNETVAKAQETAKMFTIDANERVQALFGEVSERAKGAYEKSVKLGEELTEFQKGNVEAIVESSKLAAKAAESLGQEAADYARKSFETGSAAFKTFASAKSPTELFKLQSDYMKSSFDAAVAESSKVTEAWLKLAGDIAQPLSNRFAVAVEKVKASAAF